MSISDHEHTELEKAFVGYNDGSTNHVFTVRLCHLVATYIITNHTLLLHSRKERCNLLLTCQRFKFEGKDDVRSFGRAVSIYEFGNLTWMDERMQGKEAYCKAEQLDLQRHRWHSPAWFLRDFHS